VALGGTSYAAVQLTAKQTKKLISQMAPSLSVAHANTAGSATNASNAAKLGGKLASAYQLKVLTAKVAPDGSLLGGNAIGASHLQTGQYQVDFSRPVTACSVVASIGSTLDSNSTSNETGVGFIRTEPRDNKPDSMWVETEDTSSATADNAFQLILVC
jgi:electron transfer flavoprotein alpha subunit